MGTVDVAETEGRVVDRGVVGWYRALELIGDLPDVCRIGHELKLRVPWVTYRIVRVAEVPPAHGGVVVLVEAVLS